jgi:hypothetical protein
MILLFMPARSRCRTQPAIRQKLISFNLRYCHSECAAFVAVVDITRQQLRQHRRRLYAASEQRLLFCWASFGSYERMLE